MRIKSGGPNRAAGAKAAKGASKAKGTNFANLVTGDDIGDTEERARQLRHQLLDELADLAQELEDGNTTKEEASRRFAGMVIRERFGEQKSKGGKKMVDTIGEMVENDPNFVSKLQAQLKKISKS